MTKSDRGISFRTIVAGSVFSTNAWLAKNGNCDGIGANNALAILHCDSGFVGSMDKSTAFDPAYLPSDLVDSRSVRTCLQKQTTASL